MIVHDFHVFSSSVSPPKAQSVFFVDSNAILAGAIAFQGFQSIAWWNAQVIQAGRNLKLPNFSACDNRDPGKPGDALSSRQGLSLGATKDLITCRNNNATRDERQASDGN
jgi:hypothetical protein